MKFLTFIVYLVPIISHSRASILEAQLDGGTIRGGFCGGSNSSTQFLGVPYALPPVGRLRWEAPLPFNGTLESENGVFNATRRPAVCYQFGTSDIGADPGPYDEDCLFLNIWVPSSANKSASPSLPVKVWVHGGANTGGSIMIPQYNGCNLSDQGSIVVNIAYRLGPLGFLALESAGIAGNFGIQDILLGLQWVQDNIGKFGGDKEKVLLFGQSAGAWNTWIISTLPNAPNLMRAVALESGGGVDFQTNFSAQLGGAAFAKNANCTVTDAACLKRLTPEKLKEVLYLPGSPALSGYTMIRPGIQPFVDGKVIPVQPSQVGSRVPAVFSSTSEEGKFFVFLTNSDPTKIDEEEFNVFLRSEFGPLVDEINSRYPISDFEGSGLPGFSRAAQIITDYGWKCPAYRGLTKTAERGVPVWTYIFDHVLTCPFTPGIPSFVLDIMGSAHGFDIPYSFATTDGLPIPGGNCSLNAEEKRTSNIIVDAWTSLAATGNASTDEFEWPTFTNESYTGLYIGRNSTEITSLASDYSICGFWNQINAILLEAASRNSTNVTDEIPTNPTITDVPITPPNSTETGSPTPTESQPSRGPRIDIGLFSIVVAVTVGCLLMETI
ncbi:uncharacterized protein DFL_007642 [Arthrobotrys flagrans]|uniref:Carboxylic ester hydrolase n=1 Tax=Arthrobotrys flagrans TaxID=97331 RepID=A0A436ZW88_ARTFL|nr:hypothetical protein DFL_007642 [Arthrobotrys flagrans]